MTWPGMRRFLSVPLCGVIKCHFHLFTSCQDKARGDWHLVRQSPQERACPHVRRFVLHTYPFLSLFISITKKKALYFNHTSRTEKSP